MAVLRERFHQPASPFHRHIAEQEVGEREAGERPRVVEVAENAFVAGIREALILEEPFAAELELVPALEPRELLGDLPRLDVVEFEPPESPKPTLPMLKALRPAIV